MTAQPSQLAALLPKTPAGPLPPAPCGGFNGSPGSGHLAGQKITLSALGSFLAGSLDTWVIDRTGLTGTYNLTLDFDPQSVQTGAGNDTDRSSDLPDQPSLFTAVREQLGVRLVPQTGPIPLLVIDHVERPSEN
jgi:uncharacterized protein (TIGR03435 family)